MFVTAAAIPLRDDFDGPALRALSKASQDSDQTRRLLCLAVIYEGVGCREVATLGGVGLQIVRDWVLRFHTKCPEGQIDRKPPGASPKLNDA
jgi:transposase